LVVLLRKLQHPILVNQLVAKVEIERLETLHGQVIVGDTVRTYEHKQIGSRVNFAACRGKRGTLPGDPFLQLGANLVTGRSGPRDQLPVGMEDHAVGGALEVERRPGIATATPVRHHRVGVLLSLAQCLERLQSTFQRLQVRAQALQFRFGRLDIVVSVGRLGPFLAQVSRQHCQQGFLVT
jgi:hypothetical protein